ncbi:hypothetical protein HYR54_14995 [Candidatus Acetothermia bacterium]|nr:hypothetical protein [Candidatus Acetothermia bacterium]
MGESFKTNYRAYLVRCWCEADGAWRFSTEDPHTGEKRGFRDFQALVSYLRSKTQKTDGGIGNEPNVQS